jgi:3-oxoacyl-[acyl-carrier protein] reductase
VSEPQAARAARIALVTGASRGIGLETVRRLLREDTGVGTVVMISRSAEDLDAAIAALGPDTPPGAWLLPRAVDVGDRPALERTVRALAEEVGRIDLLVNNAGYTNPVPLQQIRQDDFERTMDVNLYAPFTLVKTLLNLGNVFELIVNIASTAGIRGRSGWLTYSASKAALISMSEVMREELAIYGTRVACVSPGRTATELRRVLAPDEDPSTIMQPEDVAEVVAALASPVGRFIDSENIVVRS